MRNLIIECDIGRDADDFFALCYLAQVPSVRIRGVTITPGDPDQVAVARFLLNEFGLKDVPIGVPKVRGKKSVTPFHTEILEHFDYLTSDDSAIEGYVVIEDALNDYPDAELFCIGPVTNVAQWLQKRGQFKPEIKIKQMTMQGGFCSYDIHRPLYPLPKFEGITTCPTFNLNGDIEAGKAVIASEQILKRRFIGKNVCHAIVMDESKHKLIDKRWIGPGPFESATEAYWKIQSLPKPVQIFLHGCYTYFQKHPEKKFHDPSAAVCMLHPEIATWVQGKIYREKGGWGTRLEENGDDICVDIDHRLLWKHIINMD